MVGLGSKRDNEEIKISIEEGEVGFWIRDKVLICISTNGMKGSSTATTFILQREMELLSHFTSSTGTLSVVPSLSLSGKPIMAASSPMASQLKSTFTRTLVSPKGLSASSPLPLFPSRRHSTFTVKAIQSDKPTYQVIQPINGDPFIGSLETPVTSSPLIAWYLSNLPAYRTAVSPLLRGIEVGLAHGYLLVGPFVKAGPLRNTEFAGAAGSLAAGGLVAILSICLTIYGISSFNEGDTSTAPSLTLTGRKKQPDQLQTSDGWAKFTGGFFFGGISGVIWAYFLLYVLDLPYYIK
ncbi:photosystem I reaction center subunit XI, chloroplastic [Phaseolus vulgaris]